MQPPDLRSAGIESARSAISRRRGQGRRRPSPQQSACSRKPREQTPLFSCALDAAQKHLASFGNFCRIVG
jgi:hypothetical protein